MAWRSDAQQARRRLHMELWSWSAWLVLAIISYPAVMLIWLAPRAGLLAGLAAGLLVAYTATLGYSGKRELDRWLPAAALSVVAGAAVGAVALLADGANLSLTLLAGLVTAAQIAFVWHFLPGLARDAEAVQSASAGSQPALRLGRGQAPVRPALGLALLLALLALGLGAMWSRGQAGVPNPAAWAVGIAVLALAVMFVERLCFLERSAREGNLAMAAGSYRRWLGAALATLLLASALAALAPWRHARRATERSRVGTAIAQAPGASALGTEVGEALEAAAETIEALGGGAAAFSQPPFPLLVLLLLLLLAIALIWGFRRSRAAHRIFRAAALLLAAVVRALGWLRALFRRPAARQAAPPAPNPLLDVFAEPGVLDGMSPREAVIRTYHLVLNYAEMLGHGRTRGETPFEYARTLSGAAPDAAESVLGITWAYCRAMYGGGSAALPDLGSVRDFWHRISSALTADIPDEDIALRRRAYLAARSLEATR